MARLKQVKDRIPFQEAINLASKYLSEKLSLTINSKNFVYPSIKESYSFLGTDNKIDIVFPSPEASNEFEFDYNWGIIDMGEKEDTFIFEQNKTSNNLNRSINMISFSPSDKLYNSWLALEEKKFETDANKLKKTFDESFEPEKKYSNANYIEKENAITGRLAELFFFKQLQSVYPSSVSEKNWVSSNCLHGDTLNKNDALGYDFEFEDRNNIFHDKKSATNCLVEVKGCRGKFSGVFHLSKNEIDVANNTKGENNKKVFVVVIVENVSRDFTETRISHRFVWDNICLFENNSLVCESTKKTKNIITIKPENYTVYLNKSYTEGIYSHYFKFYFYLFLY